MTWTSDNFYKPINLIYFNFYIISKKVISVLNIVKT